MRKSLLYSIALILIFSGCVETPSSPEKIRYSKLDTLSTPFPDEGAIIVCEGLWNYVNSDIYLYDKSDNSVENSYFKKNTGSYMGDIVSDAQLIKDNRIIFTATGTRQLILMDYSIPAIINKVDINYERAAPRAMAIIADRYYYTDLYRDEVRSGIISDTISPPDRAFTTGAAPENIIAHNGKLYIANSGFGDYRQKDKNAGTLQILDPKTGESEYIFIGPNLIQLSINLAGNYIACGYLNTPSAVEKGELGGVKFVDLMTHSVIRQMQIADFSDVKIGEDGRIYYLGKGGLSMLTSVYSKAIPQIITPNNTKDIWYSLSIDTINNEIWIGNARNYQSDGEVIETDANGTILRKLPVGKNPRKVVGYSKN